VLLITIIACFVVLKRGPQTVLTEPLFAISNHAAMNAASHLGASRRENPLARTFVFKVFIIFDWGDPLPRQPCIHRARSRVREEDIFGCRIVFIFIFGLVTCSLSRTPRPPAKL
jgi:hypothetical protein